MRDGTTISGKRDQERRKSRMIHERESEEERTEDALASRGDERRGKLRKAPGICKQEVIRRCLNRETGMVEDHTHALRGLTQGTETS